ncbi:hypothetical protein VNO77_05860 [Canavalia gladiata]|uniref:Secreted protein n=1 Tax=Canavalia gladiata TaxID=3824 RepID=A0AAN9REK5_CANGL
MRGKSWMFVCALQHWFVVSDIVVWVLKTVVGREEGGVSECGRKPDEGRGQRSIGSEVCVYYPEANNNIEQRRRRYIGSGCLACLSQLALQTSAAFNVGSNVCLFTRPALPLRPLQSLFGFNPILLLPLLLLHMKNAGARGG